MTSKVKTLFHSHALDLAGENTGKQPTAFHWDRSPGPARTKVWTDLRLREAIGAPAEIKVAMLVESPEFSKGIYETAAGLESIFDYIFTHQRHLVAKGEPYHWYPFGGSWIEEWGVFDKTENVSVIVGNKQVTEGQALRHKVAKRFNISAFGAPYTEYLPSKRPMLRPFRYSIVIENCRSHHFFTEKLIDCISQGTIPIYWGCPLINGFFDIGGILQFETMEELEHILGFIGPDHYNECLPAVKINLNLAEHWRCSEDWLALYYPEVFLDLT